MVNITLSIDHSQFTTMLAGLQNVTFEFGARTLVEDATWHIQPNERIARQPSTDQRIRFWGYSWFKHRSIRRGMDRHGQQLVGFADHSYGPEFSLKRAGQGRCGRGFQQCDSEFHRDSHRDHWALTIQQRAPGPSGGKRQRVWLTSGK